MVARQHTHAVVILGGDTPPPQSALNGMDALVIAADSGWDNALSLGLAPTVLVGDFDSISSTSLAEAHRSSVSVIQHPRDKDATDAELALSIAVDHGVASIHVISGGGDRLDHILGALHVLATPALRGVRTMCTTGHAHIHVATTHHQATFQSVSGETISLIPIGGDVHIDSTDGLRWPLQDEVLGAFSSRGISNVATSTAVAVKVIHGVLFVVRPGHFDAGHRGVGDTQ